jgi:hypothetical protein
LRKNLQLLGQLQGIDLKIDGILGEKQALLERIATLDQQVAAAASTLADKQGEQTSLEEERKSLEEGLATETENIKRSEGHLREIKTQKEYQAVSKEIATAKKLIGELEEQILQKIGQIDGIREEAVGLETNLQELQRNVASQAEEFQVQVARLDAEIAGENATREATVKGLPASVVKRYTMLREQRRGVAVVEAKDGCCLGCNMNIPPQMYNTLFRGTELITCPHCQRVLILRQEPAEK